MDKSEEPLILQHTKCDDPTTTWSGSDSPLNRGNPLAIDLAGTAMSVKLLSHLETVKCTPLFLLLTPFLDSIQLLHSFL